MGATLSLLQLQGYLENVRAEFGLEGADLGEVSKLPLEEADVLEQPSEGVLGEASGWKERAIVLGTVGRGSEQEVLQSVSGTGRQLESKEWQRHLRLELSKLQDSFGAEKRSSPDRAGVREWGRNSEGRDGELGGIGH